MSLFKFQSIPCSPKPSVQPVAGDIVKGNMEHLYLGEYCRQHVFISIAGGDLWVVPDKYPHDVATVIGHIVEPIKIDWKPSA